MKQFKMQAPHMACMFFSVDDDASKIMCMSCVPEVCTVQIFECELAPCMLCVCFMFYYYCCVCELVYSTKHKLVACFAQSCKH